MNRHIGSSTLLFLSMVTTMFLFVQYGYGVYIPIQSDSNNPEELYDECVNVAGKSFCDFLFKESAVNPTNSTASMPSNYTESTNSMSGSWNASGPSINSPLNSSYLTYNDNDLGFTIQYPSDWTLNKDRTQQYAVIGFDSPNEEAVVDVRIIPKGDYNSIKEYGDEFKVNEDYTLLSYYRNSTTLLDGNPAFKATYLATNKPFLGDAQTAKGMFTGTMVPDKKSIYAIAYFANSANFDEYRPVVEKMINSFQISAKGPVIQEE